MKGSFDHIVDSTVKKFSRDVAGVATLMMARDRPGEVWPPNVRTVYERIAAKSIIERCLRTYSNPDGSIYIPEAASNIKL